MAKPTIKDSILTNRNVGESLQLLKNRMTELSLTEGIETLEGIENDYRLMCECLSRGMRDPNGDSVYEKLLRRTFRLYSDIRLASIAKKRLPFLRCRNVAKHFDTNEEAIATTLEGYVQETAMASLSLGDTPKTSVARVNAIHQRYMDDLFSSLLVAEQWNADNARFFSSLLSSPTVDQNDVLLVVSALTMALLNVFDANKWLVLADVYRNAAVESVRQRSLVGMMLTLPREEATLFSEIGETVKAICQQAESRREIRELQSQLLLCMQTEDDKNKIERDIMPTLIKNNNFKVTRSGIVERDEDTLNDILDTEAADRKMAELEDKMKKMMDMKNSGSDVYFGGFSHMKRFSFFYQLSNWFAPFSFDHPDVVSIANGQNGELIRKAIAQGPFCDSDKYSFVFALASVIDKLPASIKEVVASGKGIADNAMLMDTESAAYIRRMYLQDLYRFFKLYPEHKDFANPFEPTDGYLPAFFVNNPLLDGLLSDELIVVERHLYKNKKYESLVSLLSRLIANGMASDDEKYICALAYRRLGRNADAYALFVALQTSGYDSLRVDKGLADTLFALERYADAAIYYNKVLAVEPNNRHNTLYRSLALVNSGNIKDGLADLFRLDYENGNDIDVKRIIAWGYLSDCKPNDAERVYDWIVNNTDATDADLLNCGYAKWLLAKNEEAIGCFRKYVEQSEATDKRELLKKDFANDWAMLAKNGLKQYEAKLMIDIVCRE